MTKKKYRRYSPEFKRHALKRASEDGHDVYFLKFNACRKRCRLAATDSKRFSRLQ